jgi:multisubunit Na+/H+ antiporter MnhE subunit
MAARLGYWALEAVLMFGIWLLFVCQFQAHELAVGAAAALLSAAAVEGVRGEEHARFLPHARWLAESFRLPWKILHDCGLLVRNLFDGRPGRLRRIPFDAGGSDARSAAHRALAIFYTTLPPNTVVIGIHRARNYMLLHRLEKSS